MGSEPLRIEEPFGTFTMTGEEATVTPPHGFLSSRNFIFDRSRQIVTVSDRRLKIFGSKKNTIEFSAISFRTVQQVGAAYCIEMLCRVPNQSLVVYSLTGYTSSAEQLEPMKKAIIDGTGIDRWETPSKT